MSHCGLRISNTGLLAIPWSRGLGRINSVREEKGDVYVVKEMKLEFIQNSCLFTPAKSKGLEALD